MGLVALARNRYGVQPEERCFCLKIPDPLGGDYSVDNVGTIGRVELIGASGSIAEEIADLPNGALVRLIVTD